MFNALEELMGEDPANKLMNMLPMQPHAELVTRSDLHAMASELRGEMAELRAELRGEMVSLRAGLEGQMAELRAEFHGTLQLELGRLYRWGAAVIVANGVAVVTALVA